MCLHIHVALFQIQISFITSLFLYHKKIRFKFTKVLFYFYQAFFHFRPSYLCISFPYNEVCRTILPLGNVRTHDVNILVTNLFTTLLYLFMYTGLSITSLFTKRNSVFNSRFALIFLAKYIFQKHNMYLFSFDKEVISITSYTWQNE